MVGLFFYCMTLDAHVLCWILPNSADNEIVAQQTLYIFVLAHHVFGVEYIYVDTRITCT